VTGRIRALTQHIQGIRARPDLGEGRWLIERRRIGR
jgi:hypothetical protein